MQAEQPLNLAAACALSSTDQPNAYGGCLTANTSPYASDRTVATFSGRHRAQAPVLKLSTEILCSVLKHLILVAPFRPPKSQGWILFTHVCRRFREAALGYRQIWFAFNCDRGSLPWLGEWLSRSLNMPLSVSILDHQHGNPEEYMALRHPDNVSRFKKLLLASADKLSFLPAILAQPAPKLERLCIVKRDKTVMLPQQFLGSEAPHLHLLDLTGIAFSWSSLKVLSALKYLYVRRVDALSEPDSIVCAWDDPDVQGRDAAFIHEALNQTMANFADGLRNLPLLENLLLSHIVPQHLPSAPLEPIFLDHLTLLEYRGPFAQYLSLVGLLKAPQLRNVTVVLMLTGIEMASLTLAESDSNQRYVKFLDFVSGFLGTWPISAHSLTLTVANGTLAFSAMTPCYYARTVRPKDRSLHVEFMWPTFGNDVLAVAPGLPLPPPPSSANILLHFWSLFDRIMPSCRSLAELVVQDDTGRGMDFDTGVGDHPSVWVTFYKQCTHVRDITVWGMAQCTLLHILARAAVRTPDGRRVVLFPALGRLRIHSTEENMDSIILNFQDLVRSGAGSLARQPGPAPRHQQYVDTIAWCLAHRPRYKGVLLKTLVLNFLVPGTVDDLPSLEQRLAFGVKKANIVCSENLHRPQRCLGRPPS